MDMDEKIEVVKYYMASIDSVTTNGAEQEMHKTELKQLMEHFLAEPNIDRWMDIGRKLNDGYNQFCLN